MLRAVLLQGSSWRNKPQSLLSGLQVGKREKLSKPTVFTGQNELKSDFILHPCLPNFSIVMIKQNIMNLRGYSQHS